MSDTGGFVLRRRWPKVGSGVVGGLVQLVVRQATRRTRQRSGGVGQHGVEHRPLRARQLHSRQRRLWSDRPEVGCSLVCAPPSHALLATGPNLQLEYDDRGQ